MIKRYDHICEAGYCESEFEECSEGDWVLYSDIAHLIENSEKYEAIMKVLKPVGGDDSGVSE